MLADERVARHTVSTIRREPEAHVPTLLDPEPSTEETVEPYFNGATHHEDISPDIQLNEPRSPGLENDTSVWNNQELREKTVDFWGRFGEVCTTPIYMCLVKIGKLLRRMPSSVFCEKLL